MSWVLLLSLLLPQVQVKLFESKNVSWERRVPPVVLGPSLVVQLALLSLGVLPPQKRASPPLLLMPEASLVGYLAYSPLLLLLLHSTLPVLPCPLQHVLHV